MNLCALLFLGYVCLGNFALCHEAAKRLFENLFEGYNKLTRPVDKATSSVVVKFRLKMSQILDVNEKDQIVITNVWLYHEWNDSKLSWDPMDYENVTRLYVPSQLLWLPDTVLYNNADGNYQITIATKATLSYNGNIKWQPPAVYKSLCEIDVEWFPFDIQNCYMKFGSWTYSYNEVDLQHHQTDENVTNLIEIDTKGEVTKVEFVEKAIDMSMFKQSVEWDVMAVPGKRHVQDYPSLAQPYVDITYYLVLRRKTLFYSIFLVVPSVSISFLSVLVFYLPADSGEKMTLCISILIALTVFFLLLVDLIPSTSLVIPLIGKYLLFTMVLVTLSIMITVLSINYHYRSPTTHHLRPWMRKLFIEILPKFLLMARPDVVRLENAERQRRIARYQLRRRKGMDARMNRANWRTPKNRLGNMKWKSEDEFRTLDLTRMNSSEIGPSLSDYTFNHPLSSDSDPWQRNTIKKRRFNNNNNNNNDASSNSCYNFRSKLFDGLPGRFNPDLDRPKFEEWESILETDPNEFFQSEKFRQLLNDVSFIGRHLRQMYYERDVEDDYRYIAMVLDRFFLIIFAGATLIGSMLILLQAPALYDNSPPITGEMDTSLVGYIKPR